MLFRLKSMLSSPKSRIPGYVLCALKWSKVKKSDKSGYSEIGGFLRV